MRVKFTRNTVAAGKPVKVDDVADLPEKEATFLIHLGKAKLVETGAPAPAAGKTAPAKQKPGRKAKAPAPAPETQPKEDEGTAPASAEG